MKKVIIETPFAGNIEKNKEYARKCMKDCLTKGEAPFASHLLYTQPNVLNDDIPEERKLGIEAGLNWGKEAEATIIYTDLGITEGMKIGIQRAKKEKRAIIYRQLGKHTSEEKLIEIGKRMNIQNNRSTRLPLFIVVADEKVTCADGDGERERIHPDLWNNNEMCSSCQEKWRLDEDLSEGCDECDDNMFRWYYIKKEIPQTMHGVFLTAKECNDYIKRRSYAMKENAMSFAISAHRSEEMTEVLKYLSALGNDGKPENWYR